MFHPIPGSAEKSLFDLSDINLFGNGIHKDQTASPNASSDGMRKTVTKYGSSTGTLSVAIDLLALCLYRDLPTINIIITYGPTIKLLVNPKYWFIL